MANYEVDRAYPPRGNQVRRRSELVNVRLASWNIGSLTGKSIELVKILHRRRISIACITLGGNYPQNILYLSLIHI